MAQLEGTVSAGGLASVPRRMPFLLEVVVRMVREKPLGTVGGILVLALLVAAVVAPVVAPYDYTLVNMKETLQGPNVKHLFGTDNLGRDILSRILYGAQISMYIGFGSVAIGTVISVVIGVYTGYFGGRVDTLVQRFVDAWMAFPSLVILLTFMAILGPGLINIIIALGINTAAGNARVVRSAVLGTKENQYIEAARSIGCADLRILIIHILPNVFAPIIILMTLGLGRVILAESSLSFLGYGVPPPFPSWGGMLSGAGRQFMLANPWMAIFPGIFVSFAVFGFNMLGDGLRDVLDPRLRGSK